eukprot:TRINITY_DN3074_c0_g1_i5.p2 TRINITY_DN3074_c0_g1~~TRINITY_DN3074_c0_g1_i5.p2  ORF type:complete len:112 (+),score=29.82 TRINITY_DN3074_c0_g1_i5:116-451(+)
MTGILAAAGEYALEHNVGRVADDHRTAQHLSDGLLSLGLELSQPLETNFVWARIPDRFPFTFDALRERLLLKGVRINGGGRSARFVTHLDVSEAEVALLLRELAAAIDFLS